MVDIWVPKPILEPKDPLTAVSKVAGFVRMKVIKPGLREPRVDTGWFPNIVTNTGLNRLGTSGVTTAVELCVVGSGTAAPDPTDTALANQVASTTSTFGSTQGGLAGNWGTDAYRWWRFFKQFSTGAAEGVLREVGFSASGQATALTSRALITDGSGNPTDVTVLSDEILQVSYEFRVYFPTADIEGTFELSGTPYDYIIRPSSQSTGSSASQLYPGGSANTYGTNGSFGAAGVDPSGSAAAAPTWSAQAYTPDTFYRDASANYTLSQGNATGGIGAFLTCSSALGISYKVQPIPAIPKDNTKLMTLNVRHSWARK